MCGIAGIFAYDPVASPVDREELLRTRDAMIQRGPDGAGPASQDGEIQQNLEPGYYALELTSLPGFQDPRADPRRDGHVGIGGGVLGRIAHGTSLAGSPARAARGAARGTAADVRRFCIEEVLYQPEAAGDFSL